MAYLAITGRNDKLSYREAEQALDVYGKLLLGRLYKHVDIELDFISLRGMWGRCGIIDVHRGKCRDFGIQVNRNLCKKNQLLTLAHEMVHIKQFARGEFMDLGKDRYQWKSRVLRLPMDQYLNFPWEIEAYGMEKKLYAAYLETV